MRRFVLLTVVATALALPAAALGLTVGSGGGDDGALSVKNGNGRVALSPLNGSAVGKLAHGVLVLKDPIFSDGDGFGAWGCDVTPVKTDSVEVCTGDNIRFRAIGGKYKIIIRGTGIFLSAVGRGLVTIDGNGNDSDVFSDGVFSLNDSPFRSLPDEARTFALADTNRG